MVFQVQASGQVERDPELYETEDGMSTVTEFSLAVNTRRCMEDITIWLNCYAWGDMAAIIERDVTKGSMSKSFHLKGMRTRKKLLDPSQCRTYR